MKLTIKSVNDRIFDWTNSQGIKWAFVEGWTEDGYRFSMMTKPETAEKRREEVKALIGKPSEFTGELKTDNRGEQVYRIKDFPGKTGGGGFAGGRGPYVPAWSQSREGEIYRAHGIQAQVALKAACDLCAAGELAEDETVLGIAGTYLKWLRDNTPEPVEAAKSAEPTAPAPGPSLEDRFNKAMGGIAACLNMDELVKCKNNCGKLLDDLLAAKSPRFHELVKRFEEAEAVLVNFAF